jgi:hypothetical protein
MTKRRGGKRTNRGDDAKMKLNIKVGGTAEQIVIHHEWDVSGIGKQFKDDFAHLQTQIMDLQEQAVREKLIELGWTPPGQGRKFHYPQGPVYNETRTVEPNTWTDGMLDTLARDFNPPIVVDTQTDGGV